MTTPLAHSFEAPQPTLDRRPGPGRLGGLLRRARCTLRFLCDAGERGQAIVWLAVMLPLFISVVGLVVDGGVVLDARRELQHVADAAAHAAATEVASERLRGSQGDRAELDARRAEAVAEAFVAAYNAGRRPERSAVATELAASPEGIVVQVGQEVRLAFLPLVRIESVTVRATASAAPRIGGD